MEHRAVLVTLGDQPGVMADDLRALAAHLGDASVVASSYRETVGSPALFGAAHFAQLRGLQEGRGQRRCSVTMPI